MANFANGVGIAVNLANRRDLCGGANNEALIKVRDFGGVYIAFVNLYPAFFS